jgi:hypothetical protein
MSMNTKTSQEVSVYVNWGVLSEDIKKEFNIASDAKDIALFLSSNERKYLQSEVFEGDAKVVYTNDITGEELEKDLY